MNGSCCSSVPTRLLVSGVGIRPGSIVLRVHQPLQRGLRRRVHRRHGDAVGSGAGGHEHDPAELLFDHPREQRLGDQEGTAEIDRHRQIEVRRADLGHRREEEGTGVVDEDFGGAEDLLGVVS
jgi:hypothetical protein